MEWNYKIEKTHDQLAFSEFANRFEYLFKNEAIELTDEILKDYRYFYVKTSIGQSNINKHFKKYQKARVTYQPEEPDWSGVALYCGKKID